MKCSPEESRSRDFLSHPVSAFVLFWIPAIAIVAGGLPAVSIGWRTLIWTAALTVMGAACIANAMRCGRIHCFITGPFFLAMAVVTLLYGLGVLPLGSRGWNFIGLAILAGAIALCCLPEAFLGRYRGQRPGGADNS